MMKATGIVRRIDDLGRVVIPKEIRRVLRIREGDPLEIFTSKEGEVIFKKYSPINELSTFADEYCQALFKVSGHNCFVTDKDNVVAYAGQGRREIMDKLISVQCEKIMNSRMPFIASSMKEPQQLISDSAVPRLVIAQPIIAEGDVCGLIGFLETPDKKITETEEKLISTAAIFLGKQMEA
jgi:hypothetical protein